MVLAHVVMTVCLWPLIPSSTNTEIETDTSNRSGLDAVHYVYGNPQEQCDMTIYLLFLMPSPTEERVGRRNKSQTLGQDIHHK